MPQTSRNISVKLNNGQAEIKLNEGQKSCGILTDQAVLPGSWGEGQ